MSDIVIGLQKGDDELDLIALIRSCNSGSHQTNLQAAASIAARRAYLAERRVAELQAIINGLADRVAAQAEILARRAEGKG